MTLLVNLAVAGGAIDRTPNAFSFTPITNCNPSTVATSAAVTPTGYAAAACVVVSTGGYKINAGTYTSSPGVICPGQCITLCQTMSSGYSTTTCQVVCIGTPATCSIFCATTRAIDATPDAFSLTSWSGAALSTACCGSVALANFDCITVTAGGSGCICCAGGAWTTSITNFTPGTLYYKLTSSGSYSTQVTGCICAGTCLAYYCNTTGAQPLPLSPVLVLCSYGSNLPQIVKSFDAFCAGANSTINCYNLYWCPTDGGALTYSVGIVGYDAHWSTPLSNQPEGYVRNGIMCAFWTRRTYNGYTQDDGCGNLTYCCIGHYMESHHFTSSNGGASWSDGGHVCCNVSSQTGAGHFICCVICCDTTWQGEVGNARCMVALCQYNCLNSHYYVGSFYGGYPCFHPGYRGMRGGPVPCNATNILYAICRGCVLTCPQYPQMHVLGNGPTKSYIVHACIGGTYPGRVGMYPVPCNTNAPGDGVKGCIFSNCCRYIYVYLGENIQVISATDPGCVTCWCVHNGSGPDQATCYITSPAGSTLCGLKYQGYQYSFFDGENCATCTNCCVTCIGAYMTCNGNAIILTAPMYRADGVTVHACKGFRSCACPTGMASVLIYNLCGCLAACGIDDAGTVLMCATGGSGVYPYINPNWGYSSGGTFLNGYSSNCLCYSNAGSGGGQNTPFTWSANYGGSPGQCMLPCQPCTNGLGTACYTYSSPVNLCCSAKRNAGDLYACTGTGSREGFNAIFF